MENAAVGTTLYRIPIYVVDLGVAHVPKDVIEMYLQEIFYCYTAAGTLSLLIIAIR